METLSDILFRIDTLKKELAAARPLPETALHRIEDAMKIEYTYDSNRIEGNTLTLQETALIVNEGVTIGGKSMREHLEAINHAEAIDYIKEVSKGEIPISEAVIRDIHAIVLHSIDRDNAGRYRTVPVMISGSRFTPPQPYLIAPQMEEFIRSYEQMEGEGRHPVLVSAYLHNELVRIHPFIDGNGRTSRLLMNLYLLRKGYPIVSLKSDNDSKLRYYRSLEKAHMEDDPADFNFFVATAVLETLVRYMEFIWQD